METSFAEILLLAAACILLYRLLRPLQRRLERAFLRALDPKHRPIIDVEPLEPKGKGSKEQGHGT